MLTKLATFRGVSLAGEPLVRLFEPNSPLIKEAGSLMPQIKDWMSGYKQEDGKIAVLVNAMGASEYWGQNVNGDIFPEAALIHDCRSHKDQAHPYDDHTGKIIPPYGFWTFLNAFPFVHHRNKDPSRAFGHVALAVWNPRMHRVELIVIIDKALAMQHGAQDVVDRILAGEYPDVSMGCRVPYDVCTICGNKSKTRNDYCSCIKNIGMGKILEDGRRIGVINCHPRFFDISFVFIGADKTAKVMCKLASGLVVPQSIADADLLYGAETDVPEDGLMKAASVTEDVGKGTLAGGLGGGLGFTAMELLRSKGRITPQTLKGIARAAGEWGIAGGATTGTLAAMKKASAHGEDEESGTIPSLSQVVSFLKKNPNPNDAKLHEWAEGNGFNVHEVERLAYQLATTHVKEKAAFETGDGIERNGRYYNTFGTNRRDIAQSWKKIGLTPVQDSDLENYWYAEQETKDPEQIKAIKDILSERQAQQVARTRPGRTTKGAVLGGVAGGLLGAVTRKPTVALGTAALGALGGGLLGYKTAEAKIPNFVTSDVEDARFPDTKAVRKKLDEEVLDRVMGRKESGKDVEDSKTAGLKDLKSLKGLFEGSVSKHLKGRVGKRSIRVDKLLKTSSTVPDPTDDADTRLLMGHVDNQESASVVSDGVLRTNLGTRDEEEAMNIDRGSGFKKQVAQGRPKMMGFYNKRQTPANVWTADHSDNANLSKESSDLKDVFEQAKAIKIGPPPERNRKNFPFVGTIEFKGLTVRVENKPGSVREGKGWRTELKLPYGEILGTKGTDDDKLDVYVGPSRNAENAYIVHQNHVGGPRDGKYDEDKVMLGFDSPEQAKAAYLAHYNNPKFFRSITVMAFPLFKRAVLSREARGEKLASAWSDSVAALIMEDEFQEPLGTKQAGEVFGMEKSAAALEELFSGASTAQRRQRTWRDKVTGRETNVTGSGMESSDKAKMASVDLSVLKVANVLHNGWSPEDILKVSNETKSATHLKWADIVKRIGPSKAVGRVTPLLSQSELDLPNEVLNKMGEDPNLEKSLATPALMGMALKPREFQRIILIHIGKPDVADKMDEAGAVFKPSEESLPPCKSLTSDHFDDSLLKTLLPFLEGKSYMGPVVRRRIVKIIVTKPDSQPTSKEVDSPLLSKVASAYTWYRKEIMKLARELPSTVTSHPELHARTLGLSTEDLFSKTAAGELGLSSRSLAVLLGAIPLALLYSAHKRRAMERGEDVGLLGSLVAEHPWLTSMGAVTGLGALLRNPRAQQGVDEVFNAGQRVWQGKQAPVSA